MGASTVPGNESAGETPATHVMYVSTSLDSWMCDEPHRYALDVQINDTCYRKLDPEYFAWLRSRMQTVKRSVDAGHITAETFDQMRSRFNQIQEWAIQVFGEATLQEAIRQLDPDNYSPPLHQEWIRSPHAPAVGNSRATASTDAQVTLERARRMVDEIRDKALSLGWKRDSLYFSEGYGRHSCSTRHGLICYVGAEKRIGEVTRQSIELIGPPPDEVRTHFFNPDVEQPWIKRVERSEEK